MKKTESFETEFRKALTEVGEAFTAFPWENEAAYAAWCAQTYFYVKHTTMMIVMSAAHYGVRDPKGYATALHHLAEERGHDLLLINDLDVLGFKIDQFSENVETSLFHQNQYYMIQNEGPTSHLGYALLLEAMCAYYGPEVYKRVSKTHGKDASTFLDVHVIADQGHAEDGMKAFAALDPATAALVLKNVKQSAFLYKRILANAAAASFATIQARPSDLQAS